jgi:putative hemolysin
MNKIDIAEVLAAKAPKLARRLPKFVINWLRRTIHEEEINHIYQNYWEYAPQEFIRACFRDWGVSYSIEGIEKLDRNERYLFISNHPFGGMDCMMLADKLIEYFGDVRVVVNDILRYIAPLDPLWVPVNKHGAQKLSYARKFDEAFASDLPILTFPAGLCSRKIEGRVQDTPWRPNFLKKAYASHRKIVPIFVEGRLSNFFYNLSRLRKALGVKANIEMLWLVDEMLSQKGQHFRIIVGEPIEVESLREVGSHAEQVLEVRKACYALEKELKKSTK